MDYSAMEYFTEDQVRDILRERCADDKQGAVAASIGLSQSLMSLVVTGKRGISEDVATSLGFTKMTVFVPHTPPAQGDDAHAGAAIATP